MKQVTDTGAIEKVVDDIVAKNPDKVGAGEGEADADRLVRRPGDEGVGRQGQPAGGQRAAQGEARHLIVGARSSRGAAAVASRCTATSTCVEHPTAETAPRT